MLKKVFIFAMSFCLQFSLSQVCQADLLTSWNFNNIPAIPTTGTPAALGITSIASTGGPQSVSLSLSNFAGNIDDFAGSTFNSIGSDVAGASLSLIGGGATPTFPGNGGSIQFTVNLTGVPGVAISYASQRTGTGFTGNQWGWSVDGRHAARSMSRAPPA